MACNWAGVKVLSSLVYAEQDNVRKRLLARGRKRSGLYDMVCRAGTKKLLARGCKRSGLYVMVCSAGTKKLLARGRERSGLYGMQSRDQGIARERSREVRSV